MLVYRIFSLLVLFFISYCWISELQLDNPQPVEVVSLKDPLIINKFNLSQIDVDAVLRKEHNVFLCLNIRGNGKYLNVTVDGYPLTSFFPLFHAKANEELPPQWFKNFPDSQASYAMQNMDPLFFQTQLTRWWAASLEGKLLFKKNSLNINIKAQKENLMLLMDQKSLYKIRDLPGLTENTYSGYAWQNGHQHFEIPQIYGVAGETEVIKNGVSLDEVPRVYLVYRFPTSRLELNAGCNNSFKIKYSIEPTQWPVVVHIPAIGWILEKDGELEISGNFQAKLKKSGNYRELSIMFPTFTPKNQKIFLTPIAPPLPFIDYNVKTKREPGVTMSVESFIGDSCSNNLILNKTKTITEFKFEMLLF